MRQGLRSTWMMIPIVPIVPIAIGIGMALTMTGCGRSETKKEAKGWEVTLRGNVKNPGTGLITVTELRQNSPAAPRKDTIVLLDGHRFEKKMRLESPGYYRIDFYQNQIVDVILDKSDLTIDVDGDRPGGEVSVKGSPDLDLIERVQGKISGARDLPEANAIEEEFNGAIQRNNKEEIEALQAKYFAVIEKETTEAAAMLKDEKPSLGMIHLLQNAGLFDADKYMDTYRQAADKFRTQWPNVQYGKDFVEYVDKLTVTAVGSKAPEISLPDPNGNIITLSSYRGKYVLVDFWAKWCGPCRRENPNVVKAYHAFKNKNFDILGVSLDRNREDWLRAIDEDGLAWKHVSDLKYFESQAARDYNINGIPFSVLVNPDGVIIAKSLRGAELHKKLAEVLN
jgi:peroxiredoxin